MSRAADRIRAMDEQGIDVEALSINPFWYKADRDLAAEIIKVQNTKLVEICAAQPDRFVAFATVALQHPDLAVEQLEDAIKTLGLRGVFGRRQRQRRGAGRRRNFTRSGPRPRNWACSSSCIRRARPN